MSTLINLAVKFSGLGWLWDKVDGAKTYIAAAIAILTGLAGVLGEAQPFLAAHDAAGLLNLAKHLPQDQSWVMLVGGFGVLGLRHGIDKAANP